LPKEKLKEKGGSWGFCDKTRNANIRERKKKVIEQKKEGGREEIYFSGEVSGR